MDFSNLSQTHVLLGVGAAFGIYYLLTKHKEKCDAAKREYFKVGNLFDFGGSAATTVAMESSSNNRALSTKQSSMTKDTKVSVAVKNPAEFTTAEWPLTAYNPPAIDTRSDWN